MLPVAVSKQSASRRRAVQAQGEQQREAKPSLPASDEVPAANPAADRLGLDGEELVLSKPTEQAEDKSDISANQVESESFDQSNSQRLSEAQGDQEEAGMGETGAGRAPAVDSLHDSAKQDISAGHLIAGLQVESTS